MQSQSAPQPELRAQIGHAFNLLRQNKSTEARHLADALVAQAPQDPEVQYLAAEVSLVEGRLVDALAHLERAIRAVPGQWPLVHKKARTLLALRRRNDFRKAAEQAEALAGNDWRALWEVGRAYIGCDDPESARPLFERALACGGDDPGLLLNLGTAEFFAGEFDKAEQTIEAALARSPRLGEAVYLRSTMRRQTAQHNHLPDLRKRLETPSSAAPELRAAALYAMAKELEDLGDYEASFRALSEGAAVKASSLTQYDPQAELDAIDEIRVAYTAESMAGIGESSEGEGAIFIVGMPRTGTTLVERMLDRHPQVRAAGELMDFKQVLGAAARDVQNRQPELSLVQASLKIDFPALGLDYLGGAREAARGSRVFIDKMPVNFIYCGLIHRALPRARIVHLERHPMDSCYAVFKTLFNQAYFFSYDQVQLAEYFARYRRIMAHWHRLMPGVILDVRYEDVVADTEAQARRLLDYCGLDWHPEVLSPSDNARPSTTASAAQVREPVHARSVGRWRQYEAELAPLKARLQALGIINLAGEPL